MKLSIMTLFILNQFLAPTPNDGGAGAVVKKYDTMMQMIHRSGFEAVDISDSDVKKVGAENVKEVLRNNHLVLNCYIHFVNMPLSKDEDRVKEIAAGKAAIDTAVALGARLMMLPPRAMQKAAVEYGRKELADQWVSYLAAVVEYASGKNIQVAVEEFPDLSFPSCSEKEMRYLLDHVPDLKVIYDTGNMYSVKEDPMHYYESVADRVEGFHLKDIKIVAGDDKRRGDLCIDGTKMYCVLSGKGIVDFKAVLSQAKKHGYKEYYTVEYWPAGEETLHHEDNLRAIVSYFNSIDETGPR